MATILELKGLTKYVRDNWTYRRITLIDGIDVALAENEIFGLIGPNGAGKTTTLKLIVGLLRPSQGSVLFEGRPLDAAARAAIGVLPEQPYFYDYLSVEETLTFFARLYGLAAEERRSRVQGLLRDPDPLQRSFGERPHGRVSFRLQMEIAQEPLHSRAPLLGRKPCLLYTSPSPRD